MIADTKPKRQDYEYQRRGTACLLVGVEPLAGWRNDQTSAQRTKVDFAGQLSGILAFPASAPA